MYFNNQIQTIKQILKLILIQYATCAQLWPVAEEDRRRQNMIQMTSSRKQTNPYRLKKVQV